MSAEKEEWVLATYTVQVIGAPDRPLVSRLTWIDALREAEENINDLLPEGYRIEIKEWDE